MTSVNPNRDYFGIGINTVWLTTKDDIPVLREHVIKILQDIGK